MGKWPKWFRPSSKSSSNRTQQLFTSNEDDFYDSGGFIVPPQNAPTISTSSDDLQYSPEYSSTYEIDDTPKSTGTSFFPKFLTPKQSAQWRIADSNSLPKRYSPRNPSTDSSNIPYYSNGTTDSYIPSSTKDRLQSINNMKDDQPQQSWLAPDLPPLNFNDSNNQNQFATNDDSDYIQPASFDKRLPKSDNYTSRLGFHRNEHNHQYQQQQEIPKSVSSSPNRIIFSRPSRPGYSSKKINQDPYLPPLSTNSGPTTGRSPVSPLLHAYDQAPRSVDNVLYHVDRRQSIPTNSSSNSITTNSVTSTLEKFLPHRPPPPTSQRAKAYSTLAPAAAARVANQHEQVSENPFDYNNEESKYSRKRSKNKKKLTRDFVNLSDLRAPSDHQSVPLTTSFQDQDDDYFGATQHDDRRYPSSSDSRPGEEVLLKFLKGTLGSRGQNLAVRLMNKTPIKSTNSFTYSLNQGTEESDLEIIRRDLTSGKLYSSGVRLIGGAWCNLLLGDRFQPGSSKKQRHELTYRRTVCSCLNCSVQASDLARQHAIASRRDGPADSNLTCEENTASMSTEVLSTMSSMTRTPIHSAMANFVVKQTMPTLEELLAIGGSATAKELEIGTVVRLNYRSSAKLKFTADVSELFQHVAYTGPISHEEIYRQVTTRGVHYYLYNKGKKERKVYLQGHLVRLPIPCGVVKLGTQPMHMKELGATFLLYRKQIMSIYMGQIVLEGNSIGSFIKTGIAYFIGFGEERGVAPVYPNKTLGKTRKLGINELLLHHHMVSDLEVKCV